jgi:hypothetical protein
MEPKDKAKELYLKFKVPDYCFAKAGMSSDWRKQAAKQCALIAVDEIINILKETVYYKQETFNYWLEVKNQINKL